MAVKSSTQVEIAGLKLRNPVMTASGTFGYGLGVRGVHGLKQHRGDRHKGACHQGCQGQQDTPACRNHGRNNKCHRPAEYRGGSVPERQNAQTEKIQHPGDHEYIRDFGRRVHSSC